MYVFVFRVYEQKIIDCREFQAEFKLIFLRLLRPVVLKGRLNRVLGQHGAVQLDRRQRQLLRDVAVLDLGRVIYVSALDPLGGEGAAGDGRAAAERLEFGVDDFSVFVDFDLKLHDVSAGGRAHEAGTHVLRGRVEFADVARVLVVVDHFLVVEATTESHVEAVERAPQAG